MDSGEFEIAMKAICARQIMEQMEHPNAGLGIDGEVDSDFDLAWNRLNYALRDFDPTSEEQTYAMAFRQAKAGAEGFDQWCEAERDGGVVRSLWKIGVASQTICDALLAAGHHEFDYEIFRDTLQVLHQERDRESLSLPQHIVNNLRDHLRSLQNEVEQSAAVGAGQGR